MRKFESRFNYKLYFVGLLALFVPILLGTMGTWILIENISNGETFKEWGFTILMPTVCISFIVASIRHFYKLSPRVTITDKEIIIGEQQLKFSDIKLITVRGKTNDNFLIIPYRYESCSVLLQNEEEHSIAVENYSNGNVIRMNFNALNNSIRGKSSNFDVIESDREFNVSNELIDTRTAKKYMRTPFKSFNNYIFVGICCLMIWMMFQIQDRPIFLMFFFLAMFSMFYLVLIVQNHYFLVTDTHLIVKNLFLPTRQRIFNFDNIDYLESEDLPKQETALKVLTKNFKIYRFQSGLMNYEMFRELIRTVNERQNKK
jgi:hypothetical protein